MAEHFGEVLSIRVDELAQSMDTRFDGVNKSIDALAEASQEHFAEMRDFSIHNFTLVRDDIKQLGGRVDQLTGRVGQVEGGLARVERRLDRHEDLLVDILTVVRKLEPRRDTS
jgi:hypothetical protein